MTDIHGHCDPTFQRLADVFADNFDKGLELGASVAATVEGELVVDLWGGYRRRDRSQPWQTQQRGCTVGGACSSRQESLEALGKHRRLMLGSR